MSVLSRVQGDNIVGMYERATASGGGPDVIRNILAPVRDEDVARWKEWCAGLLKHCKGTVRGMGDAKISGEPSRGHLMRVDELRIYIEGMPSFTSAAYEAVSSYGHARSFGVELVHAPGETGASTTSSACRAGRPQAAQTAAAAKVPRASSVYISVPRRYIKYDPNVAREAQEKRGQNSSGHTSASVAASAAEVASCCLFASGVAMLWAAAYIIYSFTGSQ